MKILLCNTENGLVPAFDDDGEKRSRLKVGQVYEADLRMHRNIQFHRKAFKLVDCAWEYLPESIRNGFRTKENFRKYLTVAAGYCEVFFSPKEQKFVEYPKSWTFNNMDEAEFEELYNGVRNVIDQILAPIISKKEFDKYLSRF